MRDVHQRDATRLEPLDLLEQQVHLAGGEHCGGFVEDQHAAIANQIARDFDHLLMANAEGTHQRVGIDGIEPDLRHGMPCVLAQFGAVNPAEHAALRQTVQEQVLRHRKGRQKVQLLHDHAHAERFGLLATGRRVGCAAERHRTVRRCDKAADDLRQSALACAILAGQRQHFAGAQLQRDVGKHRFSIGLADTLNLQHRRGINKG